MRLPTLSVKQKAILLTIGALVTIWLGLLIIFTYPLETAGLLFLGVMVFIIGFVIYGIYTEILSFLSKRK